MGAETQGWGSSDGIMAPLSRPSHCRAFALALALALAFAFCLCLALAFASAFPIALRLPALHRRRSRVT